MHGNSDIKLRESYLAGDSGWFRWVKKKAGCESDHSSLDPRSRMCGIVFLLRCLRHFAGQLSVRVVLLPQLPICTFAALIKKKRAQIHAHTNSRTLPTCDVIVVSLKFPVSEAGEFVELTVPCQLML